MEDLRNWMIIMIILFSMVHPYELCSIEASQSNASSMVQVSYEIWARELTDLLDQDNILFSEPEIVKVPESWSVEAGIDRVNVTCRTRGKCIVRLGITEVDEGREYAVTALFLGWNGFVDVKGGLIVEVWARWILNTGEKVADRILVVSGSTPVLKRFTNLTRAPEKAERVELYLIVACPQFKTTTWICIESPRLIPLEGESLWRQVPLLEKRKGEYAGVLDDIEYLLKIENKTNPAKITLDIENLKNEERAIDIAIVLPLNSENWLFWINPRVAKPAENEVYAETTNSLVSGGYLPVSLYPLAAMSNSEVTLGFSIPLDKPEICIFGYMQGMGFGAFFPVGLTEAGTKHSKARIEAELYIAEKGGMRRIMELYMEKHVEWFSTNIEFPLTAGWEYSKYGLTFYQGSFQYAGTARKAAEILEKTGVYIAQYVLPWEYEPITKVSIDKNPPSYWYIWSVVEEYSTTHPPQGFKALTSLHATPVDGDGFRIVANLLRGPSYRPEEWVPRIPMNPDPDLPGYNVWNYTVNLLSLALENARTYGLTIDGVELDNFMARSGCLDLRREAIEALDWNLVYDRTRLSQQSIFPTRR